MTDVLLIATVVAFFVAAALLVRVLGRLVDTPGGDGDRDADEAGPVSPAGGTA
jgi:hypothetical protein